MRRYSLAASVADDLQAVWEYIADDSLDAADRLMERFYEEFQYLADYPGSGHQRRDLTFLPLLFWPVGSYLVVYWTLRGDVEILAVVHGARNIPNFLGSRF